MIRDVNSLHLDPQVDYIDGQTLTPMVKLHASISNPNTHEPLQQHGRQQKTSSIMRWPLPNGCIVPVCGVRLPPMNAPTGWSR